MWEQELQQVQDGLCKLCMPLREWHGSQNKKNRSASASFEFHRTMSLGAGMEPLRQTIEKMQCEGYWESIGLSTNKYPRGGLHGEHQLVASEDDIFEQLMDLGLNLCKRRARNLGWYTHGYPGCFAAICDPRNGPDVLLAMRRDHQIWAKWQEEANRWFSGNRLLLVVS